MCGGPLALLRLSFGVLDASGKNRIFGVDFVQFREYCPNSLSGTKNSRKQELALWHLVNRLVPKNAIKHYKVQAKHVSIVIKQAWNVRNYRYVGDVSASPSLVPARPRVGK